MLSESERCHVDEGKESNSSENPEPGLSGSSSLGHEVIDGNSAVLLRRTVVNVREGKVFGEVAHS